MPARLHLPHYVMGLSGLLLVACGGGGGSGGGDATSGTGTNSSAVSAQVVIPPGPECPAGGIRVDSGIDENGNGVLDDSEIETSEVVCNGEDGVDSLVAISGEPAGVNCPAGGVRIDSGPDSNGNGVLDAGEITQTEFVCNGSGVVGWLEGEALDDLFAADATTPSLARDANGNAVAVWAQDDGSNDNIWANRFTVGFGWSGAERIENTDGGNAFSPVVAVDDSGNAVAVWRQWDGTRSNIRASIYLAGSGWQADQALEAGDDDAVAVSVGMDDGGNAMAVWTQSDGTRWNVQANRYVPGSGWSGPTEIDGTDNDAQVPALAVNDSGEAVVIWRQAGGSLQNIAAARFVPGTGWSNAALLETDDANSAYNPAVAIDPDGNITAVWAQDDGAGGNLRANRYEPGAGWSGAMSVGSTGTTAQNPEIAMDANGRAWVVWEQSGAGGWDIWTNRYDAGWQSAGLLEINNAGEAREPRLAASPDGYVAAVWRQWDGFRNNIWTSRYVPGQGWGYAQVLEDDDGDAFWPRVAVDDAGNAMAVWRQFDGSDLSVFARQYVQ